MPFWALNVAGSGRSPVGRAEVSFVGVVAWPGAAVRVTTREYTAPAVEVNRVAEKAVRNRIVRMSR